MKGDGYLNFHYIIILLFPSLDMFSKYILLENTLAINNLIQCCETG